MKKITLLLLAAFTLTLSGFAENTATTPVPRDAKWIARHEGFVQEAKQGNIDLVFLGDSITDHWRGVGSNVWQKYYVPLHAVNFGISADRTQHVLWRIDHGELDGLHPKALVLMIGTNNTGKEKDKKTDRNTLPEVIAGVTAVVNAVHAKLPDTRILLLGIFPRGQKGSLIRDQVKEINTQLAKLDDGKTVTYLDIGQKFLEPDGTLSRDIMADLLHPTEKGYVIWAEAMQPTLDKLMK